MKLDLLMIGNTFGIASFKYYFILIDVMSGSLYIYMYLKKTNCRMSIHHTKGNYSCDSSPSCFRYWPLTAEKRRLVVLSPLSF